MTSENNQDDGWTSDHDDDEFSSSSVSPDETYDIEESWWQEMVVSPWKQHLVAILVAVVAAAYSHARLVSVPSSSPIFHKKQHPHVDSYSRTNGIFFCPNVTLEQLQARNGLEVMDFRVPLHLTPSLQYHYHVDFIPEGELVIDDDTEDFLTRKSKEYACMKELVSVTSQSFVRGIAFAYKTPSASDLYPLQQETDKNQQVPDLVSPSFTGFAAKFINLSPRLVMLHWDGVGGHENSSRVVAEIPPFEAVGTATTPGQSFYVAPTFDESHALERWTLTADSPLVVYHPTEIAKEAVSHTNYRKYQAQLLNLDYAKDYLIHTKRPWLSNFPRPKPVHFMHEANFMGQQRVVKTKNGFDTEELELKLNVVSVLPRVFTIENFISPEEANHLIDLGKRQGLKTSTLHAGGSDNRNIDKSTRSSTNAWIEREASPVVDLIYRRAADLLQMDESLFRHVSSQHMEDATHNSLAESIQLVHYGPNQEYRPHYDFTYPSVTNPHQPTRFATLLIYLNNVKEGGETVFPRALNNKYHDGISITPKVGKAVVFYNVLPDGNVDESSQHGSKPVIKGHKWMANLWVWDPVIA